MTKKIILSIATTILIVFILVGILQIIGILQKKCYAVGFESITETKNGKGTIINGLEEKCFVIWNLGFWQPI